MLPEQSGSTRPRPSLHSAGLWEARVVRVGAGDLQFSGAEADREREAVERAVRHIRRPFDCDAAFRHFSIMCDSRSILCIFLP